MTGEFQNAPGVLLFVCLATAFSGCVRSGTPSVPQVVLANRDEAVSKRDPRVQVLTCALANRGNADLRIGPVSTSCGCTSAIVGREVVPPGETTEISAEGHPPATGSRRVWIRVATNDPTRPLLALEWDLVGRPDPPRLLTPEPAVDLGILRPGEIPSEQTVMFDVLEARDSETIVRVAAADRDSCRIKGGMVAERNAEDPKFVIRSFRYQVGLAEAPAIGAFARTIEVLRGGDEDVPWMSIPVRGLARPVTRAVPAFVRFADPDADGKSSARLMIVCDDQSAPLVAECVAHDPGMSVRVVDREADRVRFEIEFDGGVEGRAVRPLAFRVDRPVQTTIDVPIVAATSHSKPGGDSP